jgi:hypothetical protein
MKNIFPVLMLLCSSLVFTGCASTQAGSAAEAPSLNKRALAQELIEQDWNLFASFQRQAFSDRISGDFVPDKYAFVNEVEASFYAAVPVDLSFTVNKALMQKKTFAVTIIWQRKTASRDSGDLILKEGECTIVYRNEKGQWLMNKIQGNSIFTF